MAGAPMPEPRGHSTAVSTVEPHLHELAPIPQVTIVKGRPSTLLHLAPAEVLWTLERMVTHTELVGECWEWGGCIDNGYGVMSVCNRKVYLHQLAFAMTGAELPPKGEVRHTCDNRRCWRQRHLIGGTRRDNVADMWARGRAVPPPRVTGLRQHLARLTDEEVREIRGLVDAGARHRDVAQAYGCSPSTVWRLAHRQVRA